ncbi:S8 family serine peptidase [Priestia megaterium]|nr:S8 family serine peptidase [Priestia megaterium]
MWTAKWLLVFLLVISDTEAYSNQPVFPSISQKAMEIQKTKIIVLNSDHPNKIKNKIQQMYPNITVRNEFHTAFSGLSVSGSLSDLEKLEKESFVHSSHMMNEYKVTTEGSIPFIGTDVVRGMFDNKHQRLTGKGIKVGVIDTGMDFTHPDLQRNYRGGYDVIDQDYEPMETLDYEGEATLHGTHVAGIIGANGKMKGVAPEADIYAYRALGPGGAGSSESVILAVEKAIQDGVDIINLSLGNEVNGPDLPTSLALNRAAEKGIVTVTSSGNSGPELWTVGSPGTAAHAISVGASVSPTKTPFITIGFQKQKISIFPLVGSAPWTFNHTLEAVERGTGETMKDVHGKVVLLKTGKIGLMKKVMKAEHAGAAAVMMYNPLNGGVMEQLTKEVSIPVVFVNKEAGEAIQKQVKRGKLYLHPHEEEVKDVMTSFSSRGPVTSSWDIKPDVVAPGYAIHSTIPHGYESLHGTSMAAPHVAGACALILQAHPDWSPTQVKAALMNTAKPIEQLNGSLYHAYEQGAGRIQIEKAVKAESLLYPGALTFGVFDQERTKEVTITVDNQSSQLKKYHIEAPDKEAGVRWEIPLSFTVKPKEQKEVTLKLHVNVLTKKKGIYDGRLKINDSRETFTIPYMYMVKKPDYPRVMGLQAVQGEKENTYSYELFLPEGADEVGVAMYEPETMRFITYLDVEKQVERGMFKQTVTIQDSIKPGAYKIFAYAKKDGREHTAQCSIIIE